MISTVFLLPEAAEALLHDTRKATILDMRVAKTFAMKAPPHRKPQEDYSDVEYCIRAWGHLLPDAGIDGNSFRCQYGWTLAEIESICDLLLSARDGLLELSKESLVGRMSSIRDAEVCARLHDEWRSNLTMVRNPP